MKKILTLFIVGFFSMASFNAINAQSNCNSKELKQAAIEKLSPFYYSSAKTTAIDVKNSNTEEIEIQLLKGEKYKLVFNTAELSEALVVEVYDKPINNDKRKMVFSNKDQTKKIFAYEPDKSKNLYLNYRIKNEYKTAQGCVVFALGYLLDF